MKTIDTDELKDELGILWDRSLADNERRYDNIFDALTELADKRAKLEKAVEGAENLWLVVEDTRKENIRLQATLNLAKRHLKDMMYELRMRQGLQENGLPYPTYHKAHDFLADDGGFREFKTTKEIKEV